MKIIENRAFEETEKKKLEAEFVAITSGPTLLVTRNLVKFQLKLPDSQLLQYIPAIDENTI